MKYRIIKEYGLFYPQVKFFFFLWKATEYPNNGYHEQSDALNAIQEHNKMFGKNSGNGTIVWTGELK